MFHTECIDMLIVYVHIRRHITTSTGSVVIDIKPKTKYRFHAAMWC